MPTPPRDQAGRLEQSGYFEPISVMDLFTIGIGPSSSHTVGPMRAARRFGTLLATGQLLPKVRRVCVHLYGSLALTGKGHGTDRAILLGLTGERPSKINPDDVEDIIVKIRNSHQITLMGTWVITFDETTDLLFHMADVLAQHPNGMKFSAFDDSGEILAEKSYFSVGGGFVVSKDDDTDSVSKGDNIRVKYSFSSAAELLEIGDRHSLTIAEIMTENENAWRSPEQTNEFLDTVANAMFASIKRSFTTQGVLPGGLKVRRRACTLYHELSSKPESALKDPLVILDWVNLYALAVNEENAAGGRVVTAPTNGAAGVVPAVLKYYETFCAGANQEGLRKFLLTAAAIGSLYKKRASLSAAEMGCQGEIGVACSMAAGALAAVLGGSNQQIENAAEIGMEHNLGLTCDPVGGLVQIPCIERNTMGAVKAINAARLALHGDGMHMVSLDEVIETMRQTGVDMATKYKETSQGGLAVNVVEC